MTTTCIVVSSTLITTWGHTGEGFLLQGGNSIGMSICPCPFRFEFLGALFFFFFLNERHSSHLSAAPSPLILTQDPCLYFRPRHTNISSFNQLNIEQPTLTVCSVQACSSNYRCLVSRYIPLKLLCLCHRSPKSSQGSVQDHFPWNCDAVVHTALPFSNLLFPCVLWYAMLSCPTPIHPGRRLLLLLVFLMSAILTRVRLNLNIILICMSLIARDV